jgi:ankyrin repeat protein
MGFLSVGDPAPVLSVKYPRHTGSLPKTLDATYEHTLLGIDEEKWQFAHRMFQCLAVSVRPLRVEELAEILAVRFDPGALPQFHTGWRLGDAEEAVLSACSSLISVVNVDGFRVVQFAHFSVKEFLTSDRLSPTTENVSRYHIVPHFAHTTLAQASLGVLLELDDRTDEESIRNYPLADYAARHWLDHCKFGDVTVAIQDATKYLFDRARPHFSAWIWVYDIDDPYRNSVPTTHPELPEATPLYYGILCGFPWLIEHLIATYPEDVNTRGGYYGTPLLAAIRTEDVNITSSPLRLLLEQNVDVNLPNDAGETPLYWASASGKSELVQLLIKRGANVHLLDEDDESPLKVASKRGHLDIVRLLIETGADVNSYDDKGWTSLHSASARGHVNIVKFSAWTPLGRADFEDPVHSRDKDGWTPLEDSVASHGHLDVVRFLISSGADVNAYDNEGWTPLHSAFRRGISISQKLLIQNGADVNQQTDDQETALGHGISNWETRDFHRSLSSGVRMCTSGTRMAGPP